MFNQKPKCKMTTTEKNVIVAQFMGFQTDSVEVTMPGYYYTIAEDYPSNPWLKVKNLKKAAICCNKLKEIEPRAQIYTSRYICQRNRNYLN